MCRRYKRYFHQTKKESTYSVGFKPGYILCPCQKTYRAGTLIFTWIYTRTSEVLRSEEVWLKFRRKKNESGTLLKEKKIILNVSVVFLY
jgi:hypothetical protein